MCIFLICSCHCSIVILIGNMLEGYFGWGCMIYAVYIPYNKLVVLNESKNGTAFLDDQGKFESSNDFILQATRYVIRHV